MTTATSARSASIKPRRTGWAAFWSHHTFRRITQLGVLLFIAFIALDLVFIGGAVALYFLMFQPEMSTPFEGIKPLGPLALEGRDIYIREGCNTCHTQMIRPQAGAPGEELVT